MANYKCLYSPEGKTISSVIVDFDGEKDDRITITREYISELNKYFAVSEDDTSIFFIIARAIQLKKENYRDINSSTKKYKFGSKDGSFPKALVSRIMALKDLIPLEVIETYFGDDAKIQDLNFFLNHEDISEVAACIYEDLDIYCGFLKELY